MWVVGGQMELQHVSFLHTHLHSWTHSSSSSSISKKKKHFYHQQPMSAIAIPSGLPCLKPLVQSLIPLRLATSLTSNIGAPLPSDTFNNVPSTLSGTEKARRIQKPRSAKAEACTRKCVGTCIRGGAGAPGEGPLNVRRPLVIFKEGFRSRQYCLVECSEICNLIGDGDDGP